jgi:hypothetical protein
MALKELTDTQVAWLAGIYEGEGSCSIQKKGRAFAVSVMMADEDIVNRIFNLTGIGSVNICRHKNPEHKLYHRWSVSSIGAVEFLEKIIDWLGCRRSEKAKEAINNWRTNRKSATRNDASCIYGHSFDPPNKRNKNGSCYLCSLAARGRWRDKKRKEKECLSHQKLAA